MQENIQIEQPLKTDLDINMSLEIFFVVIVLGIWIFSDTFYFITFDFARYIQYGDTNLYLLKILFLLIKLITLYFLLKLKAIGFILTTLIILLQLGLLFFQLEPNNSFQPIILVLITLVLLFLLGKKFKHAYINKES